MKVQIRFEVSASAPDPEDLFGLADALMGQLVEQGAVDPWTDVDAGAGGIGLEFVVDASDVEAASRLALRTAEATFAAVGVDGPERARVFVPADVVANIRRSEQTVLVRT